MEKLFTKSDMLKFQQDVDFYSSTEFSNKYRNTLTRHQMIDKWFEEFEENKPESLNYLYQKVIEIYNSNINWEEKYDKIFSDEISVKIRNLITLDYYDPDMDYEDDVQAYVNALTEYIENQNKNK